MPSQQMHEKRRYFRGKARPGRRVDLYYRVAAPANAARIAAVTSNIGVGGAFILTEQPPELGTELHIEIDVPTADDLIKVTAEVRWTSDGEETGMGVKFLNLDVEALLKLSEYFASLTGAEAETDDAASDSPAR